MKKNLLFLITFLATTMAFGQVTARIGKHDAPAMWTPSARTSFASSSEAKYYAQEIIDVVGLKPNFEVVSANVDNAAAVVYGGKRYVLYNPNFINALVQKTGNKWAAISVLAHEIGHHLNGHTVTGVSSQPAIELEADEFSGFVLHKLGASLADAQAAMKVLVSQTASRTHPAQYDRLTSIAKGWQKAGGKNNSNTIASVPQSRPAAPVAEQPRRIATNSYPAGVQTANRIIGEVKFNADPYAKYYLTSQYQVVKAKSSQLYAIARLSRLNSQRFPYLLHDAGNTQLLVDARGAIINQNGKQVGYLTVNRG